MIKQRVEVSLTRFKYVSIALVAGLVSACNTPAGPVSELAGASAEAQVAGMQVVDCLLPGQLRKLGNTTYLTPRRPVKTTASDCNIRGGEYVAFDRADYKTALKVWLPAAEAGDAEAQLRVGEIFERGLGTEPNYQAAVIWYERAAAQGDRGAQFNLGTLYEQGLGVEKDALKALNLYRQAWGLPEDSLMYQQTAMQQQNALREELQKQLTTKASQVRALEKQVEKLKAQRSSAAGKAEGTEAVKTEMASLSQLLVSLREDQQEVKQQLSAIPKLRAPAEAVSSPNSSAGLADGKQIAVGDLNFGKYYALIIGNRNYSALEDLATPLNDARELAAVLENHYGFKVQLLLDADRLTVMKAINELHDIVGDQDNLLIYYAGHGSLVNVGERDAGYWLPVNADPPPNDAFWVPNEFVTNHLGRIRAKRVLVVADSCYGGLLSSSPGHLFLGSGNSENLDYVKYKLPRRARLLLSSGGDKPVIDTGGEGHSVFARELIDALKNNRSILSAPDLFVRIREPVKQRAVANDFQQEPVYKSIKGAGHEVGDFFFVPKSLM